MYRYVNIVFRLAVKYRNSFGIKVFNMQVYYIVMVTVIDSII